MSVQYVAVSRGGKFAIVRLMPSGDAAGYDPVADREQEQRHFQIHRDTSHATALDAAFTDSRKYESLDAAVKSAATTGRTVEMVIDTATGDGRVLQTA